LDDIGAAVALPALGHVRARFRARDVTGKIALVFAVALRPLARDEWEANPLQHDTEKPDLNVSGFRE
jgi:hypothetical protein